MAPCHTAGAAPGVAATKQPAVVMHSSQPASPTCPLLPSLCPPSTQVGALCVRAGGDGGALPRRLGGVLPSGAGGLLPQGCVVLLQGGHCSGGEEHLPTRRCVFNTMWAACLLALLAPPTGLLCPLSPCRPSTRTASAGPPRRLRVCLWPRSAARRRWRSRPSPHWRVGGDGGEGVVGCTARFGWVVCVEWPFQLQHRAKHLCVVTSCPSPPSLFNKACESGPHRRRGRVWRGDVPAGRRLGAAERGGAPPTQLGPLHHRGLPLLSV